MSNRFYLIAAASLLLLFCLSFSVFAQSGRRTRQRPTEQPTATPTPEAASENEKAKAQPPAANSVASVIVASDSFSPSSNVPSYYLDAALDACAMRLKQSASLSVNMGGARMTRGEASQQAKKEKSSYVLWLDLRTDQGVSAYGFLIEYTLFTPGTGKVAAFGSVEPGTSGYGNGRIGVGLPTRGAYPVQRQLEAAGREIADRVMKKLGVVAQ